MRTVAAIKAALERAQEEKKVLAFQQKALSAATSYIDYVEFTTPDPEDPQDVSRTLYEAQIFHRSVAKHLEDLIEGRTDFKQLILVMPPRHGKTELSTRKLVPWASAKYPKWDIAVASYSDNLAEDFGGDIRTNIVHPHHIVVFPGHRLKKGGTAKANMQTENGGRITCIGRGGGLTGRGMSLGIGDDLFKDDQEAQSPTIRNQAWNWFTRVFFTRRMGPKLVVLCMTRWHPDDIIGRLTNSDLETNPYYDPEVAAKWKIIELPAIAEDDDILGRPVGEPLWPERFDKSFMDGQRRLDPQGFASLYQGKPNVLEGTLFLRDNVRYYDAKDLPKDLRYYCSSDHAVGLDQRRDPSCFLKIGVDKLNDIYLLECDWRRMSTDKQVEAMLQMATNGRNPIFWWAERDKIYKSIGPFLRKEMVETQRYINIIEVNPAKDKLQRAQSIAARFSQGRILFPRGVAWAERAIEEMMAFPNGTHDDFVDAISWIGIGIQNIFGMQAAPLHDKPPKFGTLDWVKQADRWRTEQEADRKYGTLS